jgi:hypothetical protein
LSIAFAAADRSLAAGCIDASCIGSFNHHLAAAGNIVILNQSSEDAIR